ncbi:MAG: penicillin-binding protein activator [Burkholderiales bacterium]
MCWGQTPPASGESAPQPAAAAADIVLLLPLDAPDFRGAADAVRQGFLAAAARSPTKARIAVRATDAGAESVVAAYGAAVEAGAKAVVGPMTRSGVAALAASGKVAVPTLALNQPEGDVAVKRPLYAFGLGVEGESRHVARLAWRDGARNVVVVSTPGALGKRTREAFVDEWLVLGGVVTDVLEVLPGADPAALRAAVERKPADALFLAAGGETARSLRLQIGGQLPVYATSQVNTAPADRLRNFDLAGVRFVDMPWIVQPDHPSAAGFARPAGLEGDAARFYALGIDAHRIVMALLDGERTFEVQGVTGRITLAADGTIDRRPLPATFRDGRCVALE